MKRYISNKIIFIVGESRSGKDNFIVKRLVSDGIANEITSYATRPMRDNEEDGREHYFINNDYMDMILKNGDIFAYTEIDQNRYCTTVDDLKPNCVYIIDPEGIKSIKENYEIDACTIYIYTPFIVRLFRGKGRHDFKSFISRCKREKAQFKEFRKNKDYDYKVVNLNGFGELAYQKVKTIIANYLAK